MDALFKDLIKITKAASNQNIEIRDLLSDSVDGNYGIYVISNKDYREVLIPCVDGGVHQGADFGEYIHQFNPEFNKTKYIDIQLGQVIAVAEKQVKELIVNNEFSEVELYRALVTDSESLDVDFWKSEREVFEFQEGFPQYSTITLDAVYVSKQELEYAQGRHEIVTSPKQKIADGPSNTAFKVIGLLMLHLAKSPKYASGTSPNKSQIKELLLDLAEELGINPYGLSKVDERVLADALKYLETQKA